MPSADAWLPGLSRAVLALGAPYVACLMATKVAGLAAALLAPPGAMLTVILGASAAATLADIVFRVTASRSSSCSLSRHGSDALLFVLFLVHLLVCAGGESLPSRGHANCRASRLLLPFAVLVSLGGNLMRVTRAPRSQ
ncbi:unnamed protein product, partial [Polarella glacialis]